MQFLQKLQIWHMRHTFGQNWAAAAAQIALARDFWSKVRVGGVRALTPRSAQSRCCAILGPVGPRRGAKY